MARRPVLDMEAEYILKLGAFSIPRLSFSIFSQQSLSSSIAIVLLFLTGRSLQLQQDILIS